jgi:hypothetical protein
MRRLGVGRMLDWHGRPVSRQRYNALHTDPAGPGWSLWAIAGLTAATVYFGWAFYRLVVDPGAYFGEHARDIKLAPAFCAFLLMMGRRDYRVRKKQGQLLVALGLLITIVAFGMRMATYL